MLDGPAGVLEAVTACPRGRPMLATAVILHPHPLYGGTLHNKVVHMLARALNDLGIATVRFNFRGVGASTGRFANGIGETEDVQAVIEWVRAQAPQAPLWLAGFSFGAYVALRAAASSNPDGLITVAPAVHLYDFSAVALPRCPWLLIQGEADEVVPVESVRQWLAGIQVAPEAHFLPGVGHFFHQRLADLQAVVRGFVAPRLPA
jgi:alpha/beta superfamily hydrolase